MLPSRLRRHLVVRDADVGVPAMSAPVRRTAPAPSHRLAADATAGSRGAQLLAGQCSRTSSAA
jgi:hypothetical protein